jgi:hypothetical protein
VEPGCSTRLFTFLAADGENCSLALKRYLFFKKFHTSLRMAGRKKVLMISKLQGFPQVAPLDRRGQ